jgi:hypothetical protein
VDVLLSRCAVVCTGSDVLFAGAVLRSRCAVVCVLLACLSVMAFAIAAASCLCCVLVSCVARAALACRFPAALVLSSACHCLRVLAFSKVWRVSKTGAVTDSVGLTAYVHVACLTE